MSAEPSAAACCAQFYEQDWVVALLGDHFHPGGLPLTDRLIGGLFAGPDAHVLDLACGTGFTARRIAQATEARVTGLDYSTVNLARARSASEGLEAVRFVQGEAQALPFEDATFDAAVCECAVSTFGKKPSVAAELARVVRPGGRLAISDMAVYGALPQDIAAFGQGWACVDDALTVEGYERLFVNAGFVHESTVDESAALTEMIFTLKKKLLIAGLGDVAGVLSGMGTDLPHLRAMLARAKALVEDGRIRYARLLFRR